LDRIAVLLVMLSNGCGDSGGQALDSGVDAAELDGNQPDASLSDAALGDAVLPDGALPGCDNGIVVKGFGISPLGYPLDSSRLGDFFTEVAGMPAGGVMWNGGWRDDIVGGTDSGTIPEAATYIMSASELYHFTPISVFGWRSGDTIYLSLPANATNDWTNAEARALFQSMLVEYVETHHPPFVFIGNENSRYYELNPSDYANWVSFYNGAYDAIKAASADTMVGPVFHYEHLSGQGALIAETTPYWQALDLHDLSKIDILGLTLYPFLNYETAAEVPATYLDPLISRVGDKPLAITETGWPAEDLGDLAIPWEQSEAAQLTYLTRLGAMLQGKNVKIVNWLFLNPMVDTGGSPSDWQIFASVSIRNSAGEERPVYQPWLDFCPATL